MMEIYNIEQVNQIDWLYVEPELLGGDLAEELDAVINNACKFALNNWWKLNAFNKESKAEFLSLRGGADKLLRASSYYSELLAVAIKFKIYDPQVTGSEIYLARDRCCKLIRSALRLHIANNPKGWGQYLTHTALVAELAFSGWLMWDCFNIRDKQLIVNALEYTADMALDNKPTYTFSSNDKILERGENKCVENSNSAKLLHLASLMLKNHKNQELWNAKSDEYYKASYAMQDGNIPYNACSDGTVISYDRVSPYAMAKIVNNMFAYNLSKLTATPYKTSAFDNIRTVYQAFYVGEIGANGILKGSMCMVDVKGKPSEKLINYVQSGKSGRLRQSELYLMDVYGLVLGYDKELVYSAKAWLKARMKYIQKKQKKHANGSYVYYARLSKQSIKNELLGSNLAIAYLTLFHYLAHSNSQSMTEEIQEVENNSISMPIEQIETD